jgi:long-subunit fatty acid transport protein
VRLRTFGVAGAWQVHPKFSIGATARHQRFQEAAFTFRFTPQLDPKQVLVQATASPDGEGIDLGEEADTTFALGFKWSPSDKFSVGGVYKQGPEFDTTLLYADSGTGFDFINAAQTSFHAPDIAGIGISYRPIPVLTINVDANHVKYSNLVDNFVSVYPAVAVVDEPFKAEDVIEIRAGAEYFFATKIPFALRAGYFRDPKHNVTWNGPLNHPDYVAAAMLYPEGDDQNHFSIGAGIAWPRFQIDAAYQSSDHYKVGSLSFVTRF